MIRMPIITAMLLAAAIMTWLMPFSHAQDDNQPQIEYRFVPQTPTLTPPPATESDPVFEDTADQTSEDITEDIQENITEDNNPVEQNETQTTMDQTVENADNITNNTTETVTETIEDDDLLSEDIPEEPKMENMPFVRLRSLDKITARTVTFEAKVGSTITFGNIFVKVQACRKSTPVEEPESAAFLQVWQGTDEWIFSGWMYASSPGLSHMDHPVYDVWVLDCMMEKTKENQVKTEDIEQAKESEGETDQPDPASDPED